MDKALFLDRDGTIVEDPGYVHKLKDFKLIDGAVDALKLLKNDFRFFIITNQSGVGRGFFTLEDFEKFNNHLISTLKKDGIKIEKTYVCPHHPDNECECRKPNTKFIKDIGKKFGIDVKNSWVIGDHPHDVEMGIKNGCKSVYLLTGHGSNHFKDLESNNIKPDFIANNFLEAANFIIKNSKTKS